MKFGEIEKVMKNKLKKILCQQSVSKNPVALNTLLTNSLERKRKDMRLDVDDDSEEWEEEEDEHEPLQESQEFKWKENKNNEITSEKDIIAQQFLEQMAEELDFVIKNKNVQKDELGKIKENYNKQHPTEKKEKVKQVFNPLPPPPIPQNKVIPEINVVSKNN